MSAPAARCRLSVDRASGALSRPRDWAASPHFSPLARISGAHSHRAPSPPRFSEGEKVAEGRMRGSFIDALSVRMPRFPRGTEENLSHLTYSPLIRLRHLLPPQKARGEKALAAGFRAREARAGNAVGCAFGALARPRDWASDNAPKAQSTDNRQRAAGGRQAAGGAAQ